MVLVHKDIYDAMDRVEAAAREHLKEHGPEWNDLVAALASLDIVREQHHIWTKALPYSPPEV